MAKVRWDQCPVCGNEIEVPWGMPIFKCKYCRRPIERFVEMKKGKKLVHLEEKL